MTSAVLSDHEWAQGASDLSAFLPAGWRLVHVAEVCKFIRGTEPGRDQYNRANDGVPFIRVGNIAAGEQELVYTSSSHVVLCDESDVLMAFDGSPGAVRRGVRGAISSGIRKVVPEDSNIDCDFLYYALQTDDVQHVIREHSAGVTIRHASKSIPHIRIAFPQLVEQKAIASVLGAVERAQRSTERVLRAARSLDVSLGEHLYTHGPGPLVDQRPLKATEIGSIPDSWAVLPLREVADVGYGIQAAVAHLTDSSKGIPILTNINITSEGTIDLGTLRFYDVRPDRRERYLLRQGDVLFNWRSGSQHHVGKTALFRLDGEFTHSSFILRMRCREAMRPEFLARYLHLLRSRGFFVRNRQQSSVNSVFNKSISEAIPVVVPPLDVQDEVVEQMTAVAAKVRVEEERARALAGLYSSLVQTLVTGRIRLLDLGRAHG